MTDTVNLDKLGGEWSIFKFLLAIGLLANENAQADFRLPSTAEDCSPYYQSQGLCFTVLSCKEQKDIP